MPQVEQSTRSTNRSFKKLVASHGITPAEIYNHICAQTVDLVFTAHPTQVLPCPSDEPVLISVHESSATN